ncbi:uncharacterized protein LOC131614721 [Vicia villosa]|uniref:uncharacterized protein LOC131614721 n=1 Tax=Vicia villosa TaxID=3911 RepID=UPI00273CD6CE|nr:uncharacterized protein LOC131614721 [Vicia villosa]
MSRPIEPLKEINDSKDLWKIAVRCKHLWTVTSSSNKEHMEMVLVDSKRDMIQVVVPAYLLSKFKSEIETGNSYIMQNFKVGKNDFAFKSTNHTYKLVFCGSTSVKKAEFPDIPHNYLNIIGLNSIVEGRFQSNLLVDLIGGITDITQTQVNGDNNKNRIVFSIVDASKTVVQCTLWGQLTVQLYEYYKNNKQASDIFIVLINARVKEAQGGFPVSVSNTWNGTKLLINDPAIEEVKNLVDLPLLSSSTVQVEAMQNSFYSDYDKFVWKAEIMSLSEITNLQHETTCVTVATLDKFDAGQMGWYKLDIKAVDGSSKAKFVFWDTNCVKLIGKSALQMKMDLTQSGDYDPLEFPYELDSILKNELAIRAVYQPKNSRLSVIGFKTDEDVRNKIKDSFKFEETSKLRAPEPLSQDDMNCISEPVSASAENDLTIENSGLTPCKRIINDAIEDNDSVQQSSTKMARDIKKEKYFKGDFSKLSNSSVQVTASQKSYYSDFDKFETTCLTVATLCKLDVGKAGWYYDVFVECIKSVTPGDGKLECYAKHINPRPVPSVNSHEPTSRLRIMEPSSPDDFPSVSEPLSVSADYDPSVSNTKLKPAKGILSDAVEEIEGVQLSSTKLIKDIKKE